LPLEAASWEGSVGFIGPIPNTSEVAFIELFNEELLIEELFIAARAGELLEDGTSFPLETEEAARFRSPMYTIDPPGDHWPEAFRVRAKNMTSKIAAAFSAFNISIDSST
jgi:hypothetical protein